MPPQPAENGSRGLVALLNLLPPCVGVFPVRIMGEAISAPPIRVTQTHTTCRAIRCHLSSPAVPLQPNHLLHGAIYEEDFPGGQDALLNVAFVVTFVALGPTQVLLHGVVLGTNYFPCRGLSLILTLQASTQTQSSNQYSKGIEHLRQLLPHRNRSLSFYCTDAPLKTSAGVR